MRRLLFVAPLPEPITGQSLACRVLLDALESEYDVRVVDLSKGTLRQGVSSLGRIREVLRILQDVRRLQHEADLVYFTVSESGAGNAKDLLILAACAPRLRRVIVHLHGGAGLLLIMRGRHGVRRRLNEFFARRLGGAIVLGERHVPVYAEAMEAGRIHVVPNFAEDYLFATPGAIRARFAAPGPLRLLFLSNLLPGKGHEELLEALEALAPEERASLRLDVAGGFESEADERAFRRRANRLPELAFHGSVRGERKRELLHAAHVFCLPTYYPYEGQPISILEAYAAGCAVVTTDHSGIFDVFAPGVNGLAVEPRSAASLVEALRAALADRDRLLAMALANQSAAGAHYRAATYQANVRRVLDVASPATEAPGPTVVTPLV